MVPNSLVTVAKIDNELASLKLRYMEVSDRMPDTSNEEEYREVNRTMNRLARQIQDWEAIKAFMSA